MREGGRSAGKTIEGGKGGKKGGRVGGRAGGRAGGREPGREGGTEGGQEGGRAGGWDVRGRKKTKRWWEEWGVFMYHVPTSVEGNERKIVLVVDDFPS